jgi:hypothetical protein
MAGFAEIIKGVKDAKVAVLSAGDVPGSSIDILGVKGVTVNVESESDQQRGDDAVLATTQEAKSLAVTITAAAAKADALAAFTGATVTTSGSTPNQIILYKEPSAPVSRYTQITAQGTGRDLGGSAFRMKILKAGIESGPTYDLGEGAWMEPAVTLRGINLGGFLFEASNYETEVVIA